MPPRKQQSLGKSIIRSRFGQHRPRDDELQMAPVDTEPSSSRFISITQESDLDSFLRTAEMAGTDFTAERLNVQVVSLRQQQSNPYLLTPEKEQDMKQRMQLHRDKLRVPRRPAWDASTTPKQLDSNERTAFLEWRRDLAYLEEELDMVLTPFERNLEVWRQLWRVLERSDIVVQIVDARHPLFFRCQDLESYVQELNVASSKKNLLLVNKADYLTDRQRQLWAEYFQQEGIPFLFFSAVLASAENEKMAECERDEQVTDNGEEEGEEHSEESEEKEDVGSNGDSQHPLDKNLSADLAESSLDDNQPSVLPVHHVYSCPELISYLENLCDGGKVTVGLVGYPNVGKSSTINALLGSKKVNVSSTPGKTKHFQTMILTDRITLCDCPGLVFPSFATTKAEMVVNGVLPIDQLREHSAPTTLVTQRIPRRYFEWVYGLRLPLPGEGQPINRVPTASELLTTYAIARGYMRAANGNPDEARAARIILKDFVTGKLLYCHPPPPVDAQAFQEETNTLRAIPEEDLSHSTTAAETSLRGKRPPSSASNSLMDLDDREVIAKTRGKHANADFRRVDVFPHQSGYTMEVVSVVDSASVVSLTSQRYSEETKMGKKAHKSGKRRVKDRSWRN